MLRSSRSGFTLVELIVSMAIIALIIGLVIPGVQQARQSASSAACRNNLKQIALAVHNYECTRGRIPCNQYAGAFGIGRDSTAWIWLAECLPYIDQGSITVSGRIPYSKLVDSGVAALPVPMFLCPADAHATVNPRANAGNLKGFLVGLTSYKGVSGANWGDDLLGDGKAHFQTNWRNLGTNGSYDGHSNGDGIFFRMDWRRNLRVSQILDGASNTFMIGEDLALETLWSSWPYSNNANGTCAIPPNVQLLPGGSVPAWNWQNNESFRSAHAGGLNFAYADGSVHFVENDIGLQVYRALATIAGGETWPVPD